MKPAIRPSFPIRPPCRRAAIIRALVLYLVFAPILASSAGLAGAAVEDDATGESRPGLLAYGIHPPIGVFGERVHVQGDVKFSYRYERITYEGLLVGSTRVDASQVLGAFDEDGNRYSETATRLDENHHHVEVAWVPFDEITLILGLPFIGKTMEIEQEGGGRRTTSVNGFGDFKITLLYHVHESEVNRLHLNLGLSLPSGSTTESNVVDGSLERLPYAMQLGSGTVDLRPGFTYNGRFRRMNWGGQVVGELHAGTSDPGYKLGNRYSVSGWLGQRWSDWFTTGFRLRWEQWFDVAGEDEQLARISPQANPAAQAGRRLDALFAVDLYALRGRLHGVRLALEAGLPAYQNLDGPQLRRKWSMTAGLQYAF